MRSIAAVALVLLAAGCGGSQQTTQPPTTSESPTSAALSGPWQEKPGQADDVQKALTQDGFTCTKHAAEKVDLRMCNKATPPPADGKPGTAGTLRFMADGKGTIVRAAVNASSGADGRKLRSQLLKRVLPEEDVAVVEAGGTKLAWGTATKREETTFLVILNGQAAEDLVEDKKIEMFKEKALPKLQEEGLKCTVENQDTVLKCYDPSRDGEGVVAASITDRGFGIESLTISAGQQKTPQNVEAVRKLAPMVLGVFHDLDDVQKWVDGHLDGREHAAYVGPWGVSVSVGLSPMFGDSVSVTIGPEKDDLGATPAK